MKGDAITQLAPHADHLRAKEYAQHWLRELDPELILGEDNLAIAYLDLVWVMEQIRAQVDNPGHGRTAAIRALLRARA